MIIEEQSLKIYDQDLILRSQKLQAKQDLEELYEQMKSLFQIINCASCFCCINACIRNIDDLEPYEYVKVKLKRFNLMAYFWNMIICGIVASSGFNQRYGSNSEVLIAEMTLSTFYRQILLQALQIISIASFLISLTKLIQTIRNQLHLDCGNTLHRVCVMLFLIIIIAQSIDNTINAIIRQV